MRLLTVPHSSYCEVARWALQAGGVDFTEEAWCAQTPPSHHVREVRGTGCRYRPGTFR